MICITDANRLDQGVPLKIAIDRRSLLKRMRSDLRAARNIIIAQEGYSEMADGFDRAMAVALRVLTSTEKST